MVVISEYIWYKNNKKIRWESGFLRGVHRTPLCTSGRSGYLM